MIASLVLCLFVAAALATSKPAFRGPADCAALCAHGGEQFASHQATQCTYYTPRQTCQSTCAKCKHGAQAAVNCANECYKAAMQLMPMRAMGKENVDVVGAHKTCAANCNAQFHCDCVDENEF